MTTKLVKESFLKKAFEISQKLNAYEVFIDYILTYRTLIRRITHELNSPKLENGVVLSEESKAKYTRAVLVVSNLLLEMERPLAYLTLSYNILNSEIEVLRETGLGSVTEFNINTRRMPILKDELIEYLDRIKVQYSSFDDHPNKEKAFKLLDGFMSLGMGARNPELPEMTEEDVHA